METVAQIKSSLSSTTTSQHKLSSRLWSALLAFIFLAVIIASVLSCFVLKEFVSIGVFVLMLGVFGFVVAVAGVLGHYLSVVTSATIFSLHFLFLISGMALLSLPPFIKMLAGYAVQDFSRIYESLPSSFKDNENVSITLKNIQDFSSKFGVSLIACAFFLLITCIVFFYFLPDMRSWLLKVISVIEIIVGVFLFILLFIIKTMQNSGGRGFYNWLFLVFCVVLVACGLFEYFGTLRKKSADFVRWYTWCKTFVFAAVMGVYITNIILLLAYGNTKENICEKTVFGGNYIGEGRQTIDMENTPPTTTATLTEDEKRKNTKLMQDGAMEEGIDKDTPPPEDGEQTQAQGVAAAAAAAAGADEEEENVTHGGGGGDLKDGKDVADTADAAAAAEEEEGEAGKNTAAEATAEEKEKEAAGFAAGSWCATVYKRTVQNLCPGTPDAMCYSMGEFLSDVDYVQNAFVPFFVLSCAYLALSLEFMMLVSTKKKFINQFLNDFTN